MAFAHREKMRAAVTDRAGRLGTTQVAEVMGVRRDRVVSWIDQGWLKARKRIVAGMPYYVIDENDLRHFLFHYGAALDYLKPSKEWEFLWQSGRDVFRKAHIHRNDLLDAMGFSLRMVQWLQQHKAFPRSDIALNSLGSVWYNRTRVRMWLNDHPDYRTARTREI